MDPLMNLMLDGELEPDDQAFKTMLRESEQAQHDWEQMKLADSMLKRQPMVAPPADFAQKVMGKVEMYEARRQLTPWLMLFGGLLGILALFGFMLPWLLLVPGVQALPIVGDVVFALMQGVNLLVHAASILTTAVLAWITLLTTDPFSLSVVVTALALSATWIGLREAQKITAMATEVT